MPHVIVKMYPGRSEEQKVRLAREIVKDVVEIAGCKERSVSVSIEEIEPENWARDVYQPDILGGKGQLVKEPGYNPFESGDKEQQNAQNLMDYVRSASITAQTEDDTGYFNAMSWLDLELEDNPQSFDPFFDKPWADLSDTEKQERAAAVRKVL